MQTRTQPADLADLDYLDAIEQEARRTIELPEIFEEAHDFGDDHGHDYGADEPDFCPDDRDWEHHAAPTPHTWYGLE